MEPMLGAFGHVAQSVSFRPPQLPLVSDVSGTLAGPEIASAAYWVRHIRHGVRFANQVSALHAAGVTRFLELGPKPTLLGVVPECLPAEEQEHVLLWPSLRADESEAHAVLEALGGYHAHGGRVDWRGVFPSGRRVDLPTYAWQRERYWVDFAAPQLRVGEPTGHPLLGMRV